MQGVYPLFDYRFAGGEYVPPVLPWAPEDPTIDLLQYWNDILDPTIANPEVLSYRPIFRFNGSKAGSLRPYQPGRCYLGDGAAAVTILGTVTSNSGSTPDNLVGQSGTITIPNGETVYDIVTELAQYKCDEGEGDTAYDSSGAGNHGTITGNYVGFHSQQNEYSYQNEVGYSFR